MLTATHIHTLERQQSQPDQLLYRHVAVSKMPFTITDAEIETLGQKAIAAKDRAYCSLVPPANVIPGD